MKKFEIINERWIKHLDLKQDNLLEAIKISAISFISSGKLDEDGQRILGKKYSIGIHSDGDRVLLFYYKESEEEQYKIDLAFLEKLLF